GGLGMLIAVAATMLDRQIIGYGLILAGLAVGGLIGAVLAVRTQMTAMPQFVALLNGFGGIASVLVAGAALVESNQLGSAPSAHFSIATVASGLIGAVTFFGSLVAVGKLQEIITGNSILLPGRNALNILLALAVVGVGAAAVVRPEME